MSGSGSAYFGLARDRDAAEDAANQPCIRSDWDESGSSSCDP